MSGRLIRNLASKLWKRAVSYRKRDWELADYPIQVREQEPDPTLAARFTQYRYWAQILGWNVEGGGETRSDALEELGKRFDERKAQTLADGEALPRPGTEAPIKFASQIRIAQHADLVDDLLLKIAGIEGAWVSDESSLWDFHSDETNELYFARIREVYGVDVSDIGSANLAEIAERIEGTRTRSSRDC